jgi:Cu/Ag efflux protein CusF
MMTPKILAKGGPALVLATTLALAAWPPSVSAQTQTQTKSESPTSFTRAQKVNATFTVESVDVAKRHVTLKRPNGEHMTLQVSDQVRNLPSLKPGDKVQATYYSEMEIALAPPGKPLPVNTQRVVTARAKEGELPGGLVANHMTITGAVVGVDKTKNLVKVVNPQGGEVHEFNVTSPEGRAMLQRLKPGDKLTAYITEGLLISAERG